MENKLIKLQDIIDNINNVNLDRELALFTRTGLKDKFPQFPIRMDALLIILCTKGKSNVVIDLKKYTVSENTIMVIQPMNYLSSFEEIEESEYHILACSKHIVEEVIPKLTDLLPLIIRNRTEPVTKLSAEDAVALQEFYRFLNAQLDSPRTPFLKSKILCILQAALYEMMDRCVSHRKVLPRTRKEEIMAQFLISVGENFMTHRQVSFYADKLCITSKHLSAVVKEISGRTAGDWIENYVVMEAKVLLKSTDLTIQEIANRLNFNNQSFFGKYFRHLTGESPTNYRKNHS